MFRCKFKVSSITTYGNMEGITVKMAPQYDNTIPEDKLFNKYTPSGEFTMFVSNPSVIAQLKCGQDYYLDFSLVEAVKAAA